MSIGFLIDDDTRGDVVSIASQKIGLPLDRISKYFEYEVSNILDKSSIEGLRVFLDEVCRMGSQPRWFDSV